MSSATSTVSTRRPSARGPGLLTAAVCGDVFASPSVDAVLAGILAVTGEAGCVLIVKNYAGDMPASTASTEGEANTSPHTAAVSSPGPTKPAWAGS
jgi:dihydroxyacetone kinase